MVSFSCVRLSVTLWTVAPHTPTPLGDSPGKNIGVGCQLPCPPPVGLTDPGIEPTFLLSAASAGGFFTTNATRKSEKPWALLSIKKKKEKKRNSVSEENWIREKWIREWEKGWGAMSESSWRTRHVEAFDHCKHTAFALRWEDYGTGRAGELHGLIYISNRVILSRCLTKRPERNEVGDVMWEAIKSLLWRN